MFGSSLCMAGRIVESTGLSLALCFLLCKFERMSQVATTADPGWQSRAPDATLGILMHADEPEWFRNSLPQNLS